MRTLVVGATRILRPAAEQLAVRDDVTGIARGAADVRGARLLRVDAADPVALEAALAGTAYDRAIVYLPDGPPQTWRALRAAVTGLVVDVRTSAVAADPAFDPDRLAPRGAAPWVTLVLGWTADGRWHTPEEISAAALSVLSDGRTRVLGAVHPWSSRPS